MSSLIIGAESNQRKKLQSILQPYQPVFVDKNHKLEEIGNDISFIVLLGGQEILNYSMEIRQKGILVPILVIKPELAADELAKLIKFGRVHILEDFAEPALIEKINMISLNQTDYKLWQPYLSGPSKEIRQLRESILAMSRINMDLFLYGEPGCGQQNIIQWWHRQSCQNDREFIELNLNNYTGENYEGYIWIALKDIFQTYPTEYPEINQPLYSTLYVKGLENKDILFIISFLEWLFEKKRTPVNNFGNNIRTIITVENRSILENISKDFLGKYLLVELLPLRQRKSDLVFILNDLLNKLNQTYNKEIKNIDLEVLNYIYKYSWPGNIDELRYNLEAFFLASSPAKHELILKDLLLNDRQLFEMAVQKNNGQNVNYQEALTELKRLKGIMAW